MLVASAWIVSLLSGEGEVLTIEDARGCALSVCSKLAISHWSRVRGTFLVAIGLPGVGWAAGRRSGSREKSAPPKCGGCISEDVDEALSSGRTMTLIYCHRPAGW